MATLKEAKAFIKNFKDTTKGMANFVTSDQQLIVDDHFVEPAVALLVTLFAIFVCICLRSFIHPPNLILQ